MEPRDHLKNGTLIKQMWRLRKLKNGKSKGIISKIMFKKGESGESVRDLLNKLMNETVSV